MKESPKVPRPLASQGKAPKVAEFQFERQEWVLFRSPATLSQKAGVPLKLLRRLVLKELADNALDAGATVKIGAINADRFYVEDDGPGISGDIAKLFSLNRPLISSKLWRLPSRGALGNGLRVVMGAVAASNGSLEVWTQGNHYRLLPQDDGSTKAIVESAEERGGTRIEIEFGAALPRDNDILRLAATAINMGAGEVYQGRPSPHWYDTDQFYELLRASPGERPLRDLIASLDGCSGAKAGQIVGDLRGAYASAISRQQSGQLLTAARTIAKPVRAERLGHVGELWNFEGYSRKAGYFETGTSPLRAKIPFVVEAWAKVSSRADDEASISVCINRSPTVGRVQAYKPKGKLQLFGCGLRHQIELPKGTYRLLLNIITPYMPITSDGKEPDLDHFAVDILEAIEQAAKRARRASPQTQGERVSQKSIVIESLPEAIAKASNGGKHRFNQRQLFYVIRPMVQDALGAALNWENFCSIITAYEDDCSADIEGMYRDPRGSIYHPHLRATVPLGTLMVESYDRPLWTFNKILFVEKEGIVGVLASARWAERHDCALLSSKGYSSRAARDLIDLIGEHDEPVTVFCIHDADASGTLIYQTLQEATRARPARRVEVINLGLEPWEALAMGLSVEDIEEKKRQQPVADYVQQRPDGEEWAEWLQAHRVELNAMTTEQLIAWLDAKMTEYDACKVVPPSTILAASLKERVAEILRQIIRDRILRAADFDGQATRALGAVQMPSDDVLRQRVEHWLSIHEGDWWKAPISEIAKAITRDLPEA